MKLWHVGFKVQMHLNIFLFNRHDFRFKFNFYVRLKQKSVIIPYFSLFPFSYYINVKFQIRSVSIFTQLIFCLKRQSLILLVSLHEEVCIVFNFYLFIISLSLSLSLYIYIYIYIYISLYLSLSLSISLSPLSFLYLSLFSPKLRIYRRFCPFQYMTLQKVQL